MTLTITDQILFQQARQGKATRKQLRLARQMDIDIVNFSKAFRTDIVKELETFGKELEEIAGRVLSGDPAKASYSEYTFRLKNQNQSQDALNAAIIANAVDYPGLKRNLDIVYEKHYRRILSATQKNINATLALGLSIVDEREAEILATATERIKLLKLDETTSKRVFDELAAGRLEGESVPQLARRIRDSVPAGRFKSTQTRALLIARTEATHAQKMAAAETYRANQVTEVLILDARKGPTDAECESWNGQILSLEAGVALMNDEHPNGTRRMVAQPPSVDPDIITNFQTVNAGDLI